MNEKRICLSRAGNTNLRVVLWLTLRVTALCLFTAALAGFSGCVKTEPVQKLPSSVVTESPRPKPTARPDPVPTSSPAEPQVLEGSGITVWAKEFPGQLIEGLDGSLYEPYARSIIERVQKALGARRLYTGPVNGILDLPTMKSIFAFQKANYHLQHCGVPTPHTRKMLAQGSHTDLIY